MPYKLTTPQPAADAVGIRITNFSFAAEPNVMRVEFATESAEGIVIARGSELFDASDLDAIDKKSQLRATLKAALYAMLAPRLGAIGTLE